MNLIQTLLVYMVMVVSAATEAAPAFTPLPPEAAASPAPTAIALPTRLPTALPTMIPTAIPTATPVIYTTLYLNDRGSEVKKLQRRLAELGYLHDKIDGIYGQKTKKAVERFQYYNDLRVDGIAGRATQTLLYQSTSVVTAPPTITEGPRPTATMPLGVNVPVYYVDQQGRLLKKVDIMCYSTTTIYANDSYVGPNYELISSGAVTVNVRRGMASPASVTFRYRWKENVTPAPALIPVPVTYLTNNDVVLYQTTASLPAGQTSYVTVNTSLVPSNYQLISPGLVSVSINRQGQADPAAVTFRFNDTTPPAIMGTVNVHYMTEDGQLLHEAKEYIKIASTADIYADPTLVPEGYQLISQSPIRVEMNSFGKPLPDPVVFIFRYPLPDPTQAPLPTDVPTPKPTAAPTAVPTEIPTPVPTEEPTPAPTEVPTPVPTEEPTPAPTEEPTPVPTEEPTPVPTEEPTPVPTEEPTPAPTEEPTPAPTEVPTPVPTEVPTPVPTEEPTPVPTEVPTPAPTEVPTPVPTEVPTPVPTEVPTPVPTEVPQQLTKGGDGIELNGNSVALPWYTDQNGQAVISLSELAKAAGWAYAPGAAFDAAGHQVVASFSASSVDTLTIDGQNQAANGLVWKNDLYVNLNFLRALGADANLSGGIFTITFP